MDKKRFKIITDALCGVIMLVAVTVYLILGAVINFWHPGWVIVAGAGMLCGIIGAIADAKKSICGVIMLSAVLVYIILGLTIGFWNPGWVIVAGAGLLCGIIGTITDAQKKMKKLDNPENNENDGKDNEEASKNNEEIKNHI